MSLKRALLLIIALVLAVGTIPAGIVAHGRLARALREQVTESLAMAPELLASRWSATVDVRMMHARDVARTPGLAEALMAGDGAGAARMVEQAGAGFPEAPVLYGPDGASLIPSEPVPESLLEATRRGDMPVEVVPEEGSVRVISLAPVVMGAEWVGAAGGTSNLDGAEAATLAGLTRSDVLIRDATDGVVGASMPEAEVESVLRALTAPAPAATPAPAGASNRDGPSIRELPVAGVPHLLLVADLSSAEVLFLKDLDQELAVLPLLRGIALWSAGITLVFALALGTLFAARLARPVGSLAAAADRLATGDFDAPLERSGIGEVGRVSDAFDQMRRSLRARLAELEEANRALADKQERLVVLQGELVQRDRLASSGRLLAQLAHEIRNPIASIRNCLEVLRRRAADDQEAREFADMAIDELLRMHELTEQMLDVHRPRDPEGAVCDVTRVALEVGSLLKAGAEPGTSFAVTVVSPGAVTARMADDALKQVLLNLGLNAQEAMKGEGPMELVVTREDDVVRLDVLDRGPGIPKEILPRIFDPFFTTKAQVQGVGLGLFTAEAIVRTYGGRIRAAIRDDGPGARFTIELPPAPSPAGGEEDPREAGEPDGARAPGEGHA